VELELPEEMEIIYEGWNGRTFHWSGGELAGKEGVSLALPEAGVDFEDMYESPFETIYNSTAFEVGGRYGGVRENMMEFTLAFHIRPTVNTPWRIIESRFRKALHHKNTGGKIRVKIVGESERWLNVRLRSQPKLKLKRDPIVGRYGLLIVTFVANFPRWVEDDYTAEYVTTTDTTAGGDELAMLWISNPTNNEAWPKWVCQAGNADIVWTLPDFSWGDDRFEMAEAHDDRMLDLPELILGEHVVVDTDEMTMAGQVVSSLDTQVYLRMDGREFLYPLPAYLDPVQVPISVTGAQIGNLIQVRIPRTWSRPWGLEGGD